MNIKRFLKQIAALILVLGIGILFAACKSSSKTYYEGFDDKKVYASNDKYTVTYGEMYEELTARGVSLLPDQIDKLVLKKELSEIDLTNKEHKDFLVRKANNDI